MVGLAHRHNVSITCRSTIEDAKIKELVDFILPEICLRSEIPIYKRIIDIITWLTKYNQSD